MMDESFVEECWFIYGLRLGSIYLGFLKYHSKGTAGSVDFDWHKALTPLLIGWYHSHPGRKFLTPSSIDDRTMRSWIKATNKKLLCGIFCQDEQRCYCYYKDGMDDDRESVIYRKPVRANFSGFMFLGVCADIATPTRV
jgi:hypothetical protein